ncbi:MAG: type VI secretion system tube protein TssD [Pedobacter sp.]
MKNLFTTAILLALMILSFNGYAQEDSRIKIVLSVNANGKAINTPLNGVSTSVARYYDEAISAPVGAKAKDTVAAKLNVPATGVKAGIFYLNLDAKSVPDDLLKLIAGKNSTFDGTVTITDSFGKLPSRTIKFFKANLYSYSDQYSSTYYNDSVGSVAISISCSSLSINGILIEQ